MNNGILLKGVLIPKLLNNPYNFCCFTNLDFSNPHSIHFDFIINLPFFVLKIFEFKFSGFFMFFYKIHQRTKKYLTKSSKLYSFFILSKNALSVKHSAILLLLLCLILRLIYLDAYIQCVFCSFHNNFVCVVICENYFLFFTCFKRVDFLEPYCPTLFFIAIFLF